MVLVCQMSVVQQEAETRSLSLILHWSKQSHGQDQNQWNEEVEAASVLGEGTMNYQTEINATTATLHSLHNADGTE